MQPIETKEMFDLIIIIRTYFAFCERLWTLIFSGNEKLFIKLLCKTRGRQNGVPIMKNKLRKLTVRVLGVSCKVLLAFPHRLKIHNQTFNNFSFHFGHDITP